MMAPQSNLRYTARRLRLPLLLALIVVNVLVITLTAYSVHNARDLYVLRAEALARNVASAIDLSLSDMTDKIDLALRVMVDQLETELKALPTAARNQADGQTLDVAVVNAYMARLEVRIPEVTGFRAANAKGLVYLGNGLNPQALPTNNDRDYFMHHQRGGAGVDGGLFITKPVIGRVVKEPIIIFARRYNLPNGEFAGVVHAVVALTRISSLLATFDLGPQSALIVRDTDMGLVVRLPAITDRAIGQVGNMVVSPELRNAYAAQPDAGVFHAGAGATGIPRIGAYQKIKRAPMLAIASVSTDNYLSEWEAAAAKATALALGFFFMSSLMGWLLWRLWHQTERDSTRNRIYLQNASDGVQIADVAGNLIEVNARLCDLLGYSRSEMLGMSAGGWAACWPQAKAVRPVATVSGWAYSFPNSSPHTAVAGPDTSSLAGLYGYMGDAQQTTVETQVLRKTGGLLDVEVALSKFRVDDEYFLHASVRDITERKAASDKIKKLAFYDPLTQLPNRRLMLDRLKQAVVNSARHQNQGALMVLDLDNFKVLNDSYGHDMGDRFLVEAAKRLKACLRDGDTAARLGGDEFVVILERLDGAGQASAEKVATKILTTLAEPFLFTLPDQSPGETPGSHRCTTSIGLVLFKDQTWSLDELLKRADTAMYQAKTAGRNTIRVYQ